MTCRIEHICILPLAGAPDDVAALVTEADMAKLHAAMARRLEDAVARAFGLSQEQMRPPSPPSPRRIGIITGLVVT